MPVAAARRMSLLTSWRKGRRLAWRGGGIPLRQSFHISLNTRSVVDVEVIKVAGRTVAREVGGIRINSGLFQEVGEDFRCARGASLSFRNRHQGF